VNMAFHLARRIMRHLKTRKRLASTAGAFVLRASQQKNSEEWLVKNTLGKPEFLEDWSSIAFLLGAGYWTRIWIIQEAGLAKKLTVYCGHDTIEWDALCLVHRVWHDFSNSIATTTDRSLLDWYVDVQCNSVHVHFPNRMAIRMQPYALLNMLKVHNVGP
jgi:hypothetical protein